MDPVNVVTDVSDDDLTIERRKPWMRWLATLLVAVLLVRALFSVVSNDRFGWDFVGQYLGDGAILQGLLLTLFLTAISMAIGIVLGVLLAVMRQSSNKLISSIAVVYIWFFRGTPLLVQLLFWFNLAALYPIISFGIPGVTLNANALISPVMAAILGLGLNEASYMSEIVRAGLLSVERGQSEAAAALGLPKNLTLRRVILPQAMRMIIPPTANQTINMLKATSLVSVLAVHDLLYSAQIIYARNFQTIALLLVASIWYLAVTSVLSVGQHYLEKYFAKGERH